MAALAKLPRHRLVDLRGALALLDLAELEVVEHQPALTAQDLHPIVRQPMMPGLSVWSLGETYMKPVPKGPHSHL